MLRLLQLIRAPLSKAQNQKVVNWAGQNPNRISKLVELFFTGTNTDLQRAASALQSIARHQPAFFTPHVKRLVVNLDSDVSTGIKRNTMRLLQVLDIPLVLQGKVVNHAFHYMRDSGELPAVKVFSMSVVLGLTRQHPDLVPELRIAVEDLMRFGGPAIRSRGTKVLNKLAAGGNR